MLRLDSKKWSPVESPAVITGIRPGSHHQSFFTVWLEHQKLSTNQSWIRESVMRREKWAPLQRPKLGTCRLHDIYKNENIKFGLNFNNVIPYFISAKWNGEIITIYYTVNYENSGKIKWK